MTKQILNEIEAMKQFYLSARFGFELERDVEHQGAQKYIERMDVYIARLIAELEMEKDKLIKDVG